MRKCCNMHIPFPPFHPCFHPCLAASTNTCSFPHAVGILHLLPLLLPILAAEHHVYIGAPSDRSEGQAMQCFTITSPSSPLRQKIYRCMHYTRFTNVKSKTYTRKTNPVKFLQDAHDIFTGGPLAEKWRKSIKKKYISCGVCISLYTSMTEQLNHIDNEYFKLFQGIHQWGFNNVMLIATAWGQ